MKMILQPIFNAWKIDEHQVFPKCRGMAIIKKNQLNQAQLLFSNRLKPHLEFITH